jgi:hypothetical protein
MAASLDTEDNIVAVARVNGHQFTDEGRVRDQAPDLLDVDGDLLAIEIDCRLASAGKDVQANAHKRHGKPKVDMFSVGFVDVDPERPAGARL